MAQKDPHRELSTALQTIESELTEKADRNQHIIDSLESFDAMINDDVGFIVSLSCRVLSTHTNDCCRTARISKRSERLSC